MKRVIKVCLLATLILLSSVTAEAVPALSKPVQVRQKDGTTITIINYGDEFYHYTTTTDGYLIHFVDGIYEYATVGADGIISPLGVAAKNPSLRTSVDRDAIAKASRGVPEQIFRKMQAERRSELVIDSPFTLDKMKNEGGHTRASVKKERVIVLLAQFTDTKFVTENSRQAFTNMLNQEGYSKNGATGSARDYYYYNSGGLYDVQMDVVGPYTLPHEMAYYGGNSGGGDARSGQMIIDVCKAADGDVDFSEYANDGFITRLFVYYAGHNEAEGGSPDSVWPHRSIVLSQPSFDGVKLYDYACSSELSGSSGSRMAHIGTFCHEYGHCLGLADYYNTIGGEGTITLGFLSLMNSGNYNNNSATPPELSAYDKSFLGWLELEELPTSGKVTLEPLHENKGYYIPTGVDGEFFVFENRDMTTVWNRYISTNMPNNGMYVYHVDRSDNYIPEAGTTAKQLWYMNRPNGYQHECFKIVRAEKVGNAYPERWIYPGKSNVHTTLSASANNEFRAWSGDRPGYVLTNIATSNGDVTFDVECADSNLTVVVTNSSGSAISNATVTLIRSDLVAAMNSDVISIGSGSRATSGYYSANTNSSGKATLSVDAGAYRLFIGKEDVGYLSEDIDVIHGTTTKNYQLGNINVGPSVTLYNYADDPNLYLSGSAGSTYYGVEFKYDDIKSTSSNQRIVSSIIAPRNSQVKVAIKKNSDAAIIKEYSVGSNGMIDLTSCNVVLGSGDKVIVGINNFSFALDSSDNPEWGYNLASNNGNSWSAQRFSNVNDDIAWDITVGFSDYKSDATSMTLTNKTYNLTVGEVEKLQYNFTPASAIGQPVWKSSNEEVAIVDATGVMRVVGPGSATITASLNGKAATGSVTVNATAEVTLSEPEVDMSSLSAIIRWTPLVERDGWSLYYKSNIDTEFSKIDVAGHVTSCTIEDLIAGATYEVYLSGKHTYLADEIWGAVFKVFALDGELVEPEVVVISSIKDDVYVGESFQLIAKVLPEDTYDKKINWSCSPASVGTIDEEGNLTILRGGELTVTATTALRKVAATVTITVKNAVADIVVEPYQNDAIITWGGKDTKWQVTFSANGGGLSVTEDVDEPMFHIDCLKPSTEYSATITPYDADGKLRTEDKQGVQVKTLANSNNGYASITAKGEYSTSDIIPLRVADIQGTQESIEWFIDGKQVEPPTAKLSAGRHKIEAVVRTRLGSEKLIKFVTVK